MSDTLICVSGKGIQPEGKRYLDQVRCQKGRCLNAAQSSRWPACYSLVYKSSQKPATGSEGTGDRRFVFIMGGHRKVNDSHPYASICCVKPTFYPCSLCLNMYAERQGAAHAMIFFRIAVQHRKRENIFPSQRWESALLYYSGHTAVVHK